ncbi:hypothetical protein [Nocardia farcinica]|uniref:hypothetical protein n=1 Tax=Nocardia farcinica TaxID=37329 RepID=UPI002453CF9E|nr:hypothetical protein [Nocardia farcinica]
MSLTISSPAEYVTYSELLALQDKAEYLGMLAHLGGKHADAYHAAIREVAAARTTFERQRAEEEERARTEQEERERRQRMAAGYVRILDRSKATS